MKNQKKWLTNIQPGGNRTGGRRFKEALMSKIRPE